MLRGSGGEMSRYYKLRFIVKSAVAILTGRLTDSESDAKRVSDRRARPTRRARARPWVQDQRSHALGFGPDAGPGQSTAEHTRSTAERRLLRAVRWRPLRAVRWRPLRAVRCRPPRQGGTCAEGGRHGRGAGGLAALGVSQARGESNSKWGG